ncbi:MAG: hypothetical protein Q4B91_02815 [Atopobiaceae bacterium]|nr:hypothetical protein [Atopobiaceae bacterium]
MRQTTLACGALLALVALLAFAGCASGQVAEAPEEPAAEEEATVDEFVSTAMVVTFGDGEKYDELVAQIWQPKDPSEPPLASLEYTTELAATSVMLGTYGYTWTYEEGGSKQTVTADGRTPPSWR